MSKESIASSYIKEMQQKHLSKPYFINNILITGVGRPGSIGGYIQEDLYSDGWNINASNFNVIETITDDMNRYQVLIMCHGVSSMNWLEDAQPSLVKEMIDVNLYGTINVTAKFVQDTIYNPCRKKIISIGSMAYDRVLNASSAYCASKAGVAHFIRCAAWELAPKGYDVYCIHPSNVDDSPMHSDTVACIQNYRGISKEEAEAYWSSGYVRGRSLRKEEISSLVKFLLTPEAEFLSGQQFELTGGQR